MWEVGVGDRLFGLPAAAKSNDFDFLYETTTTVDPQQVAIRRMEQLCFQWADDCVGVPAIWTRRHRSDLAPRPGGDLRCGVELRLPRLPVIELRMVARDDLAPAASRTEEAPGVRRPGKGGGRQSGAGISGSVAAVTAVLSSLPIAAPS